MRSSQGSLRFTPATPGLNPYPRWGWRIYALQFKSNPAHHFQLHPLDSAREGRGLTRVGGHGVELNALAFCGFFRIL